MPTEITVEPGEAVAPRPCSCCGAASQTACGFVYRNGDAYSVYHASWSFGHPERGLNIALKFGDWSEAADPRTDRFQVALEIRSAESQYEFEFLDPSDSAWSESSDTPMLSRAESLEHPEKAEFLHVAEHVVFGDSRLKDALDHVPAAG
jgi:hypothetical protein